MTNRRPRPDELDAAGAPLDRSELDSYRHDPPPAEAMPDPRPGSYYVTVQDTDTGRVMIAAGPWPDHAHALAAVPVARTTARRYSDRASERAQRLATWGAWGTSRIAPGEVVGPGPLNDLMPPATRPPDLAATIAATTRAMIDRRAAVRAQVTGEAA